MRIYSSSTKVSHPIQFSGHFNRLPDNGKLARDFLNRRKRREQLRSKGWFFQQGELRVGLRSRKRNLS